VVVYIYTRCSARPLLSSTRLSRCTTPSRVVPSIYLLLEFFLSLCLFIIHDGCSGERTIGVKMALPVCLGCLYWLATGFYIVLLPPDTVTIPLVLFVGKKTSRKRDGREKIIAHGHRVMEGNFGCVRVPV